MAFARQDKEVSPFVAARFIGEEVAFIRNDYKVTGSIQKILDNSVIVKLSIEDSHLIGAKSDMTVVSYKKLIVQS